MNDILDGRTLQIPERRESLIRLIKCVAKKEQKERERNFDEVSLSTLLDSVDSMLGYNNWSLFHKDLAKMTDARFAENLIDEVASEMEVDEGPWGVEDYGDPDDMTELEVPTVAP